MFTEENLIFIGLFLLVAFNFFVWREILNLDYCTHIIFFDVGQGDSAFLKFPQGCQVLIDGGPSQIKILKKLSKEIPFWDQTIDLVVASHLDYDHINGLLGVLKKYKISNVLIGGIPKNSKTEKKFWQALKKEKTSVFLARKGTMFQCGGSALYVLYPFKDSKKSFKKSNNFSAVLKLVSGNTRVLFPGDIEQEAEIIISEKLTNLLRSDILKASHHGSRLSNNELFLWHVQPKIAIISVGKDNPYGHPHQETLRRFQSFGINVLRTDYLGDIEVVADSTHLKVDYSKK